MGKNYAAYLVDGCLEVVLVRNATGDVGGVLIVDPARVHRVHVYAALWRVTAKQIETDLLVYFKDFKREHKLKQINPTGGGIILSSKRVSNGNTRSINK